MTIRNSTRMCSEKNCWSRPTTQPSELLQSHSKSAPQANNTGSSRLTCPRLRGFNPRETRHQQKDDGYLVFIVPSGEIGIISTKFVRRQGRFSWRAHSTHRSEERRVGKECSGQRPPCHGTEHRGRLWGRCTWFQD